MTATNERTGTRRISTSPGTTGQRSRLRRRYEDAVIQAEVRRLARALARSRVLQTDTLRRAASADNWPGVGFETATE